MAQFADFQLNVKQNWCPGCGDYSVQAAIQRALVASGRSPHETAIVSGIGCSSRLPGYVYSYGFHSIHGRSLPLAQGLKMANRNLTVLVCGGDGDGMAIGLGHTLHAMRRNIDITYIMMDNHVYGLTKGQTSPRSDVGFETKTTPSGSVEPPLSVLELAVAAGAGFVAQGFSKDLNELAILIEQGIRHEGFAFINVFSPCVTFNPVNTYEWYSSRLTKLSSLPDYDPGNRRQVMDTLADKDGLVTGLVYRNPDRVSYQDQISGYSKESLSNQVEPLSVEDFNGWIKKFR